MKPILLLDFDGVLHSYTSGWQGVAIANDPPVDGAEEFIRAAAEHFEVFVFSSRSSSEAGRKAMRDWSEERLPGVANLLHFPPEKPPAFVGLDDRTMLFTGKWPDIAYLRQFKPWNKE